eukprot:scaffold93817_cov38-Phaeocystis_antarctica.AAC.1
MTTHASTGKAGKALMLKWQINAWEAADQGHAGRPALVAREVETVRARGQPLLREAEEVVERARRLREAVAVAEQVDQRLVHGLAAQQQRAALAAERRARRPQPVAAAVLAAKRLLEEVERVRGLGGREGGHVAAAELVVGGELARRRLVERRLRAKLVERVGRGPAPARPAFHGPIYRRFSALEKLGRLGDEILLDRHLSVHDARLRFLQQPVMQQRMAGQFQPETDAEVEEQLRRAASPTSTSASRCWAARCASPSRSASDPPSTRTTRSSASGASTRTWRRSARASCASSCRSPR